jgi:hypothetical protein
VERGAQHSEHPRCSRSRAIARTQCQLPARAKRAPIVLGRLPPWRDARRDEDATEDHSGAEERSRSEHSQAERGPEIAPQELRERRVQGLQRSRDRARSPLALRIAAPIRGRCGRPGSVQGALCQKRAPTFQTADTPADVVTTLERHHARFDIATLAESEGRERDPSSSRSDARRAPAWPPDPAADSFPGHRPPR